MGEGGAKGRSPSTAARNVPEFAGIQCGELHCSHECMREGVAVGGSPSIAARNVPEFADTRCGELQRSRESARERAAVGGRASIVATRVPECADTQHVVSYSAATRACEKGSQWEEALGIAARNAPEFVDT